MLDVCFLVILFVYYLFYYFFSGLKGDQSLFYIDFKIDHRSRLIKSSVPKPLPLSSGSSLRWVGYTDEGSLSTLDYDGMLRILYKSIWRPVCHLDKQVI